MAYTAVALSATEFKAFHEAYVSLLRYTDGDRRTAHMVIVSEGGSLEEARSRLAAELRELPWMDDEEMRHQRCRMKLGDDLAQPVALPVPVQVRPGTVVLRLGVGYADVVKVLDIQHYPAGDIIRILHCANLLELSDFVYGYYGRTLVDQDQEGFYACPPQVAAMAEWVTDQDALYRTIYPVQARLHIPPHEEARCKREMAALGWEWTSCSRRDDGIDLFFEWRRGEGEPEPEPEPVVE